MSGPQPITINNDSGSVFQQHCFIETSFRSKTQAFTLGAVGAQPIQIALALFFLELAIKMWYTAFQRLGIPPSMSRGQIHHSLMIPTGIAIPYSLTKVALVGSGQGIVHCISGM